MADEMNSNPNMGEAPEQGSGGFQATINDIISDPQKRTYAVIAVAVIAVLLITIVLLASKPKDENRGKLVPLVKELKQSRAFEIVAKLKMSGIEAKVIDSDKPGQYLVQVYENAVETSYLALSRTNLLEDEGYGLFDSSDWAASDYEKRIKLIRAMNGDLSKIISRLDGLRVATVRVNIPEQQLFTEMQNPTTATVQVELENDGEQLSKSQVKSIVNILRGYLPNIQGEHISIVDTQGHNYSTFKEEEDSDVDEFITEIEKINNVIKKRIAKYLDAIIGDKDYKVSVSASVSREKIEQQQTNYTEGAVGTRQTSSEGLNAGRYLGESGPGLENKKNYNHRTVNETLLPNFEQRYTTYLPGRVTDVSVALALDKSIPGMMSLKQLQESVAAIIGPNINPDNVKITIVDMHIKDNIEIAPKQIQTNWFMTLGIWGKTITIIGVIAIILILVLFALSFLSSSANNQSTQITTTEDNNEFDSNFDENFSYDNYNNSNSDFGESEALRQQEELLREMMNESSPPAASLTTSASPYSTLLTTDQTSGNANPAQIAGATTENSGEANEEIEFENLLNNFQSVASNKPDLLAKKIEVWLDNNE